LSQTRIPTREQFSGSLIGQCLGDALGVPVEGMPGRHCQTYVNKLLRTPLAGLIGRGRFPFGQYSDDSQLARELLQSYVARRRFDPADYAQRIAAIFAEGRIVGQGQATTEAARQLIHGVPWDKAGTPPPSAGNGSAMRAGPVGLLFYDDPDRMIQVACDQGRITHQDPRCSAGAVAIAGAVALALQQQKVETAPFVEQLATWVERVEPPVSAVILQLTDWVKLSPEDAFHGIVNAGMDPDEDPDWWDGISPFVISSVCWSLYSFLRTPEDYWETICTAIAVGGDVDTTAAMAGAISGAHLGLDAVRPELAQRLQDNLTWRYDDLVRLAHQAYDVKHQPTSEFHSEHLNA
jgi:ADP-ribosylglycohydrolase